MGKKKKKYLNLFETSNEEDLREFAEKLKKAEEVRKPLKFNFFEGVTKDKLILLRGKND